MTSPIFDTANQADGLYPPCPKCNTLDAMEHRSHRFSTERGPNMPDADWDECQFCGYQTDPE
jgi:hypothetical protein